MAVLIEGLQGSGKSYYAVYKMYHDGDKYAKIFTNIDGIKQTDKILPLEFRSFVNNILIDCYNSQVAMDGDFKESIEILQKFNILPPNVDENNRVLIVVDEAQNYFGKSVKLEPALVWFITQHRHLYIELYLITQKYTLLRPDYHLFNLVYKAYPPVKQFNKNKIRYMEYAGLPLTEDNLSKKFTLPKEQQVYDMYVSGDKVESPSILKRFFWLFIILLLFLFLALYFFISIFVSSPSQEETSHKVDQQVQEILQREQPKHKVDNSNQNLYTFVVWDDGYFNIREIEGDIDYPVKFLSYLKDNYFVTVVDKINMGQGMTMIYVICNDTLSTFLSKPKTEKQGFKTMDSFTPI